MKRTPTNWKITRTGKHHLEKILPILKKQSGFIDETVLTSDMELTRVLALSFWKTKDDAERYHREQYPKINEMLSPLLETAPVIRTYRRYIQHDSPGKDKESNWLPAPSGPFLMFMRLYWPRPEALDGKWKQPPLQRAE